MVIGGSIGAIKGDTSTWFGVQVLGFLETLNPKPLHPTARHGRLLDDMCLPKCAHILGPRSIKVRLPVQNPE